MSQDLINRFNAAKDALQTSQQAFDDAMTGKDAFIKSAFEKRQQMPTTAAGYEETTTPVSHIGTTFRDRTAAGYKLVAMRPHQFSVSMVWQPKELKSSDIAKVNQQGAQDDWSRRIQPFTAQLQHAQTAFDAVSSEVEALKNVFAQV